MSAPDSSASTKDERLNGVIAEYLRSIERGEFPDRAELLALHPEFADDLQAFFADHDRFRRAATPLAQALTLPPGEAMPAGSGPRVKYFGDYELLEEIARGGMGVVYKARQLSLNRPVALKMILAGELATPEARQRFRLEAEAAANLQHPNIVAIHEVGEHEGQQYYSMDFVAGKNLAELVREHPLPAARAAAYVKTIAEAVHFAHQRGTLHRDLKPQNVLIDADDRPRITDFGLAKRIEADSGITRTGDVLGSPSYMPPEQAESRPDEIGPHSDVYSLGAVLYELLCGRPPFRGATSWETICQVLQAPPVPLRKLNSEVPQDLETICLKCLEKEPQRRYHSARDLAEELGRFLKGEPIHARPISLARRAAFWARQHPWVIAAIAAMGVLGLSFVSYGLWAQNRFLVWLQSHPDYVRAPGPRVERLKDAISLGSLLMSSTMFALAIYLLRERRGQLDSRIWPYLSPQHAPTPRWMWTLGITGGVTATYGFVLLALITETYVWENRPSFTDLGMVYLLFWSSLSALLTVSRAVRRSAQGSSAQELPAQAQDEIRQAVIGGDMIWAIRLYRRRVSGASLPEAKDFVSRLAKAYEAEHPGEIDANLREKYRFRRIRPSRLLVGILAASVAFAVILAWIPASERRRWLLELSGSCFLGFCFMVGFKRSSPLARFLLGLAVSLLFVVGEVLNRAHDPTHFIFGAFFVGFLAGSVLFRWTFSGDPSTVQSLGKSKTAPGVDSTTTPSPDRGVLHDSLE
jgi:serine/threonine protein kinase